MQTFEHLITTRPHDVTQVLISDLHLPAFFLNAVAENDDKPHTTPAYPVIDGLMQAFLRLLDDLLALPNLKQLFILGDWFDAWIGDDAYLELSPAIKSAHPLTVMLDKLTQLTTQGCSVLVMHGNRDFMLTQKFCDLFSGELIAEPTLFTVGKSTYRLEHGDALCTDDIGYQRLRRVTHNKWVQWGLAKLPLSKRLGIAHAMRQKSQSANEQKSVSIMDVNSQAVQDVTKHYDGLIHGHTHRPACHQITPNKKRFVLGDWRIHAIGKKPKVEAVIGVVVKEDGFRLVKFQS